MIYNDDSTKLGIINELVSICFGTSANDDTTAYPLADKTRDVNKEYENVVSLILQTDNNWRFDDYNNNDLPIATSTLNADQQDYGLNAALHYKILRIEILDSNGNSTQLREIDYDDKRGTSMTEFQKTAGIPRFYDLEANSIFLYPKPNYTKALGLKVYFQRGASYFVSDDTTKTPGFNEMFHEILPLGAGYSWLRNNNPESPKIPLLKADFNELRTNLITFYSSRHRGAKTRMTLAGRNEYLGDSDFSITDYRSV